jgi:isoleucyl-tRNA synthetase
MERTGLRESAMKAIGEVEWVPGWSVNRISAMVGDRPDWCISRQRAWGVPIPVFSCTKCGETVATDATFDAVIELFETDGADAWFTRAPHEYLPAETACGRCGAGPVTLKPESDIVDVWWESGVSHTSVLEARSDLHRPAELYLEGSDQHRGWFQSSLLTSVGAYGRAPFERVMTHGFIVDGDGRKMSKSVGNVVSPLDVIKASGADIIRLWVASADYGQDVSVSSEILDRTSESYRRVRNAFRFLLSNLFDFDPAVDSVPIDSMPELDRFALVQLSDTVASVTTLFDEWRFYAAMRVISDYLGELSSVYLDVAKDRLYADAPESVSRRSAQTVLAVILGTLVRILAPVLSFTCEEVWEFMPAALRDEESVLLSDWPTPMVPADADPLREAYSHILDAREHVTKALEDARNDKVIGKSQQARLVITVPAEAWAHLSSRSAGMLSELFIVSAVELTQGDAYSVAVREATGNKCPRCWNFRELGVDPDQPEVCARCAEVLRA